MAAPPIPVLYLEAMEETKKAGKEPDSAGNSGVASMGGEQLQEGLLAHGKEWSRPKSHLNGKARTARIQEYPQTVRACTYTIGPPYTERYVWWCERSARHLASYSISARDGKSIWYVISYVIACLFMSLFDHLFPKKQNTGLRNSL